MKQLLDRVEKEIKLLKEDKALTERELDAHLKPLTVVNECISMRDCRLGSELTYDDGDTELKKELCIIENNQRILRDQCQLAWEQLNRLQEMRFKLDMDVTNKSEAKDLDAQQLEIDESSASVSFKTDPLRVPKK
jgi:tektin-2